VNAYLSTRLNTCQDGATFYLYSSTARHSSHERTFSSHHLAFFSFLTLHFDFNLYGLPPLPHLLHTMTLTKSYDLTYFIPQKVSYKLGYSLVQASSSFKFLRRTLHFMKSNTCVLLAWGEWRILHSTNRQQNTPTRHQKYSKVSHGTPSAAH